MPQKICALSSGVQSSIGRPDINWKPIPCFRVSASASKKGFNLESLKLSGDILPIGIPLSANLRLASNNSLISRSPPRSWPPSSSYRPSAEVRTLRRRIGTLRARERSSHHRQSSSIAVIARVPIRARSPRLRSPRLASPAAFNRTYSPTIQIYRSASTPTSHPTPSSSSPNPRVRSASSVARSSRLDRLRAGLTRANATRFERSLIRNRNRDSFRGTTVRRSVRVVRVRSRCARACVRSRSRSRWRSRRRRRTLPRARLRN